MSEYKGFITQQKYLELMNILNRITDTKGLENKLHHLYQPDTDMNDKICENLKWSKVSIFCELQERGSLFKLLALKILEIEEEN